jgi:hypothetical protein
MRVLHANVMAAAGSRTAVSEPHIGRIYPHPRYYVGGGSFCSSCIIFCAECTHRKKKVRKFSVPSRDVTTKLSLGGNNDVITELFLPRGSLVSDIPAGDGKLVNLFYGALHSTFNIRYSTPPPQKKTLTMNPVINAKGINK